MDDDALALESDAGEEGRKKEKHVAPEIIVGVSKLLSLDPIKEPQYLCIAEECAKVELPSKMGFPRSISPKMQPSDHRSTVCAYFDEPRRISGARYQRVAM